MTALDISLGKLAIIGYKSGLAKVFALKTSKEEMEFKPVTTMNESHEESASSAITHIKVSQLNRMVFFAHND